MFIEEAWGQGRPAPDADRDSRVAVVPMDHVHFQPPYQLFHPQEQVFSKAR